MIGYRKQAGYPRKQAAKAGQEQAGSITGWQARNRCSTVYHSSEDDLAPSQSETRSSIRLAKELPVRLISRRGAGEAGRKTAVEDRRLWQLQAFDCTQIYRRRWCSKCEPLSHLHPHNCSFHQRPAERTPKYLTWQLYYGFLSIHLVWSQLCAVCGYQCLFIAK